MVRRGHGERVPPRDAPAGSVTDVAWRNAPTTADSGRPDHTGWGLETPEMTLLGRIDAFPTGRTETLTLTLAPDRYVLICNLPGSYQLGMTAEFKVA